MLLLLLAGLTRFDAGAQSMGISSSAITPDPSSILEMRTTSKGLLIPRMTTAERDAITSPATGLMIFNSTSNKFNFFNGSSWTVLFSGTSGLNSITGTSNRITIGGTAADPTVDISSSYAGQSSITTLGTVSTGVWNGTLITSTYGGTGNGFTKFSGPTTSEKTFTLPDASATILTDNATVTVAQGGTGVGTITGLIKGNGTSAFTAATSGTDYSAGTSALASGILKSTTATGALSIAVPADFPTLNQNTTGSAATLTTSRSVFGHAFNGSADLTGIILSTYGGTGNGFSKFTGATTSEKTYTLPDASTTILTKNYTGALATGIVKNTTSTGELTIAVPADFPTLNQNTTGSAATLTTGRNIYGNTFNGSADLNQVIASTYGGTGNGFTKFSGPLTAEKTFTLPNASATILTDNATVTVAQGGTGVASTTAYGVITGGTTSTGALQNAGTGTTGQVLISNGSSALPTWQNYASGSLINVRFITSGTTYTPTTATTKILIEMVGGGGGGGGADNKGSAGSGGGAGGYIKTWVTGISDASSYTIAIGTGGAGGAAAGGGNGTTGGATTFTTLAGSAPASTTFTCNGGDGGPGSASGTTKMTKEGGAGGTSTNGDISAGGAPGGWSISRGNAEGISTGAGGSSQFGGGGVGIVSLFGTIDLTGNAGSGKGAGGGGAYAGSATGAAGGDGSAGLIVIYEYR